MFTSNRSERDDRPPKPQRKISELRANIYTVLPYVKYVFKNIVASYLINLVQRILHANTTAAKTVSLRNALTVHVNQTSESCTATFSIVKLRMYNYEMTNESGIRLCEVSTVFDLPRQHSAMLIIIILANLMSIDRL